MVLNTRASLFVYFKARADIFELCGGLQSSAHAVSKDTMKWNGMCGTWKQLSSNMANYRVKFYFTMDHTRAPSYYHEQNPHYDARHCPSHAERAHIGGQSS